MVRRASGDKKKDLIISVSKSLFYEKGYASTTFEDISNLADIPASSIAYHFSSKRNLAAVIQEEFQRQNKVYMEKLIGDGYSNTVKMALEIMNMWKKYFENGHLRRFMLELDAEHELVNYCFDVVKRLFRYVAEEHAIEFEGSESDFATVTQIGTTQELLVLISNRPAQYSCREVARYSVSTFCKLLGLSPELTKELIEFAEEVFPRLPIDNRYFESFAYNDKFVYRVDFSALPEEDSALAPLSQRRQE